MAAQVSSSFRQQVQGYRLATAEILYHMPDHPGLLQSFVWQHYDIAPEFPKLAEFLAFWEENIEGALHSVRVVRAELVSPSRYATADAEYALH